MTQQDSASGVTKESLGNDSLTPYLLLFTVIFLQNSKGIEILPVRFFVYT